MATMWVYYEPPVAGTPPVMTLEAGEVARAFGVASATPLGVGSFGETWRLTTPGKPDVAAKVIKDDSYPMDRLRREVESLTRANSPNVVRLLNALSVDLSVGARAALVFDFVNGGDVASHIVPGRAVDDAAVHRFARGLVNGVVDLHACSTVHRDIKPENVALRGGDWSEPVILDLGLAKILDLGTLTAYPTAVGTPPFMAPEQLRGDRANKLADMFAVGTVLHLLLAGEHPFYGPRSARVDETEAVRIIASGPKPLPIGVPDDLKNVVTRLLSPTPYKRGSAERALGDLAEPETPSDDHPR